MIPYGHQHISEADIQAVVAVLKSDWLTQGPAVPRFESMLAEHCGIAHAVAFNSATSALHAACMALEIGPGDLVWTSPNTFVASANCARYCGAEVDFVDIDPLSYNLSTVALEAKLVQAQRQGRLPKLVIAVHFGGQSCDMTAIGALARRYGFKLIEDASHAIGARWEDTPVGACLHSDITVFSFHPVKVITSAEGGMAMTGDGALAERLAMLRSHGTTRDPARLHHPDHGGWYYEQQALGYNYRMTDVHAALGASQMTRLDVFLNRRRELVERYHHELAQLPLRLPHEHSSARSAWHLYAIQLDDAASMTRRVLYDRLRAAGIGVNVHYIPIHLQPYYRQQGHAEGSYPEAERYYRRALSLPLYYGLEDAQQDRVISVLRQCLAGSTRGHARMPG